MCETIAEALAAGEPLTPEQTAHVSACSTCKRAETVVLGWRPKRVENVGLVTVERVQHAVRRRNVRRVAVVAVAAVAAVLLVVWPRPPAVPEPDLFAELDDADALLATPDGNAPMDEIDALFEPDFEPFDLGDL